MSQPSILVVDDEADICQVLQEVLEDEGYVVHLAENASAAREARLAHHPALILLDIWMPDTDGVTLLREWIEQDALEVPVIMMSGHGTVETAVEATRLGAYDYLEKPLSMAKLLVTVERALETDRLRRENEGLRRLVPSAPDPVGRSPEMQALRERVQRIADHDSRVLIQGEAGAGKEVIARYLHRQSPRRDAPFVVFNAGGLTGEEGIARLLGTVESSGAFQEAGSGSLLINDVADLDAGLQARLQAVLEAGQYQPQGNSTVVSLDCRVLAATRQNLAEWVRDGRFREDLYYQLNVLPLEVPPLRQHVADIPDLVAYFVDQFVNIEGLPYREFSTAAQNRLRQHAWPGNVRELKNLVQRLLILGGADEVGADEVEIALGGLGESAAGGRGERYDRPLREARDAFERAYLEYHLRQQGGSVGKVAQIAGVERTHLYRKLKNLGIDPKQVGGGSAL